MLGGGKGRRGAVPGGGGTGQERVRTHLLFASKTDHHTTKKKRRPHNKLTITHKKDEMVQAGNGDIDPSAWTGNQRVLHFGPMAQRDPYFYYYPKGWDVLYPAHFGFFPYRTDKFRGSSCSVCTCSFGVFFVIGGAVMVFFGYVYPTRRTFSWSRMWNDDQDDNPPPIQLIGPFLLLLGALLLLISLAFTFSTTNFFKLYLHHTRPHNDSSRLTTITTLRSERESVFEKHPYQPLPPPAYPVLPNRYAHSNLVRPKDQLKLYPPIIPGYSTLSLHARSPESVFIASPYNTLRAASVSRVQTAMGEMLENRLTRKDSSTSQSNSSTSKRRAKSMPHRHKRHSSHISLSSNRP